MKTPSFLIAVLIAGFSTLQAQQQISLSVGDVKVDSMETEVQNTPDFQAGNVKTKSIPNPRSWLELEVEFSVDGNPDVVIPELLFRYYIALRDKEGATRVLTGDVTHINIVPGEETYSAVYVAPSKLGGITGDFRTFREGSVLATAVEIYYNGVIVGGESSESGSRAKFWTAVGTEPGILGRDETPFALLWIDRYAESAKR